MHQVKLNVGLQAEGDWIPAPDLERRGEERPPTLLNKASSALLTMVKD